VAAVHGIRDPYQVVVWLRYTEEDRVQALDSEN
jgi:hypothetical protein